MHETFGARNVVVFVFHENVVETQQKKLSFHCVESILNNPAYMKYLRRSSNHSNLSFLQWLRLVDEKKESNTKPEQPLSALKWCRCSMISFFSNIFYSMIHTPLPKSYITPNMNVFRIRSSYRWR